MERNFSDLRKAKKMAKLLVLREQLKTEIEIQENPQAKEEYLVKILLLNQQIGTLYRHLYLDQKKQS